MFRNYVEPTNLVWRGVRRVMSCTVGHALAWGSDLPVVYRYVLQYVGTVTALVCDSSLAPVPCSCIVNLILI
jgi:hypothetical protein